MVFLCSSKHLPKSSSKCRQAFHLRLTKRVMLTACRMNLPQVAIVPCRSKLCITL
jgi:hypothetical protein